MQHQSALGKPIIPFQVQDLRDPSDPDSGVVTVASKHTVISVLPGKRRRNGQQRQRGGRRRHRNNNTERQKRPPALEEEASADPRSVLPDGQILRSYVFGPSGSWTTAPLRYAAKFDPFLSLDCARVEGLGAQGGGRGSAIQGKEGIKFCCVA